MPTSTTAEPASAELSERLYGILTGDGPEDRACASIPEAACTDVPRNYLLNLANGACTKLAEQLASPGLTLPWMMAALGVQQLRDDWVRSKAAYRRRPEARPTPAAR